MTIATHVSDFSGLTRWDVKHLVAAGWHRGDVEFVPVRNLMRRRDETHAGGLRYGSIHFDGSISQRGDMTRIAGRTSVAHPGDVVFSKIDARNGAIGVIPQATGSLAFTAEFPIYEVDTSQLMPKFAGLLLRTRAMRKQLDALAVGHSGRKRLPPEVFETLMVPKLDLVEQGHIASRFDRAMEVANRLYEKAEPLAAAAASELLVELGIDYVRVARLPLAFTSNFRVMPSWSVRKAGEQIQGVLTEISAAYPVRRVGGLAELRRGVAKAPTNRPARYATPYIRVANVQPGYVDLTDVQELDVPPRQLASARLQADDVLICRNNSLEWVGKAALWSAEIDPCVHDDHVFVVRCDRSQLDPAFLVAYLQTDYARAWFMSEAQITTNLAGIAGSVVTDLRIPVPALDLQRRLGRSYADAMDLARSLKKQVTTTRDAARDYVEWAIVYEST